MRRRGRLKFVGFALGAFGATLLPLAPPLVARAASVAVLNGTSYRTAIFPNDQLTVRDPGQITGKRVNLRQGVDYPACDNTNYSICDGFTMLDKLDGFDIQPRVTIPFTGAIDIKSVNDSDVFVQGPGGRTQLMQLVWDPASNTLNGITNAMLDEGSQYKIVVTSAVKDASGNPVDACGGTCVVPFTTRTATSELIKIRKSLDDGSAFATAGIPAAGDRKLSFTQNGTPDVFPAPAVLPSIASPANGIVRLDQTTPDPDPTKLQSSVVPNLIPPGFSGTYAFGSFKSPRYQYRSASLHQDNLNGYTDGVIPTVPSKQTPQPFGYDQLGLIVVLPAGPAPAGGWPVAIYGPGFTRSKYDIFVTADYNATLGVATVATDPAGHGYGTASEAAVTTATGTTTFLSYGRGRDLDGDGCIADGLLDGVGPTPHRVRSGGTCASPTFSSQLPSHKTVDGLQSGLMQTAIDNMTLQRAIASGVDIPTVGNDVLSHTNIYYYGLSFGSIYGTMLMGADNHLSVGLLNVGGGVDTAAAGPAGDQAISRCDAAARVVRVNQLVRPQREPGELRPAAPAAQTRGPAGQEAAVPERLRRRHGAQRDCRNDVPLRRPLRPRHLLPPRQVGAGAAAVQPARLAGRPDDRPGGAHRRRAAAGRLAGEWWHPTRQHQPAAAGGAGGHHRQFRLPALRRPRDRRALLRAQLPERQPRVPHHPAGPQGRMAGAAANPLLLLVGAGLNRRRRNPRRT